MTHYQLSQGGSAAAPDIAEDAADALAVSEEKPFRTLQAQLAIQGYGLDRGEMSNGVRTYYASRWGRTRELRSLDAVRAFARVVGVPE